MLAVGGLGYCCEYGGGVGGGEWATGPYHNQNPYTTTRRSVLQPDVDFRKTKKVPIATSY